MKHKSRFAALTLAFAALLFLPPASHAEDVPVEIGDWTFYRGSGESKPMGSTLPLVAEDGSASVAIEGHFDLPLGWTGPLGIILYKNDMAFQIYVNGQYIDSVGRQADDFFFEPYITHGVLVSELVLKSRNTIRLVAYNDVGSYRLRMLTLHREQGYKAAMARFQFLDIQLPRLCCALLAFVFLYSMFNYLNYREKRESLYLALTSLFFAAYLLNVTVSNAAMPYMLLKSSLYACFPLSMIFLYLFLRRFLSVRTPDRAMAAVVAAGAAFAAGYFFQKDTAALNAWHSIMLCYPIGALGYAYYGAARGLKARRANVVVLAGLTVAVAFSAYDMYYFVTGRTPFVLLQGVGIMVLILSTFFTFSQDMADATRKVLAYSADMERSRRARDELFVRIKADADKSESAGAVLSGSVDKVGALVSQYMASVDAVNANLETQSRHIESNKRSVDSIFGAIEETSEMVTRHAELVGSTVDSIAELAGYIRKTDALVKESGAALKRLTSVCLEADSKVKASSRAIDDLGEYSKNINEIVESISDLADKTNILSINAAIEAARSGAAGKGFAVVAAEIRSLASKSGDSTEQIGGILRTMVEKILRIQEQEGLVSQSLSEVVRENGVIERGLAEVNDALDRQVKANDRINGAVSDLVAAVRTISEQSRSQEESGSSLKASMDALASVRGEMLTASAEQRACNDELLANLVKLQSVSKENIEVISDLQSLVAEC